MSPVFRNPVSGLLILALLPVLASAEEVPRRGYSAPIGLTQANVMRTSIVPLPRRIQGPASLCQASVTVEVLDAHNLTVLATEGPTTISIGNGFQADFNPTVGPPPARQEIVVRTTIERVPNRPSEEGALPAICPVRSSIQVFDSQSGRTEALREPGVTKDFRVFFAL